MSLLTASKLEVLNVVYSASPGLQIVTRGSIIPSNLNLVVNGQPVARAPSLYKQYNMFLVFP